MRKDLKKLKAIYSKTDGYCHLCHKKLSFSNHGKLAAKGAWHVEHSIPKAKGGSDHINNLYPACIGCNMEKKTLHTKSIRKRNEVTRAPYNRARKQQIKEDNTIGGMIGGGIIGSAFGPVGTFTGIILGGVLGDSISPKK